jgi:hypothetical protein
MKLLVGFVSILSFLSLDLFVTFSCGICYLDCGMV